MNNAYDFYHAEWFVTFLEVSHSIKMPFGTNDWDKIYMFNNQLLNGQNIIKKPSSLLDTASSLPALLLISPAPLNRWGTQRQNRRCDWPGIFLLLRDYLSIIIFFGILSAVIKITKLVNQKHQISCTGAKVPLCFSLV